MPPQRRVHRIFDSNFRVSSESVNGANPVAFQFNADGLLVQAGDLTLSPDPESGRLTGSTLGAPTMVRNTLALIVG